MAPFRVNSVIYHYWCPNFFSSLSDVEYHELFSNLWNHPELKCPSWQSWTVINKELAEPTAKILKHMTFWFDPEWRYPEAAQKTLQTFTWTEEVKIVILEKSTLAPDGMRGYAPDADTTEVANLLIREVWEQVRVEPLWRDAELTKQVSKKSNLS
jgi:hypothetical protein